MELAGENYMIGQKKLSTIRAEVRQALAAEGDPLEWLERLTTSRKSNDACASGGREIVESLRRLLEATEKPRKRRTRAKK
jgi:hypothetical protein